MTLLNVPIIENPGRKGKKQAQYARSSHSNQTEIKARFHILNQIQHRLTKHTDM